MIIPHMLTNPQSKWGLRLATFGAWALACASVAYWGFKVGTPGAGPLAAMVPPAAAAQADPVKVARLLGGGEAPVATPTPSAASRFSLVGVVAGASRTGTALIAVDGKPAKPYRVGAAVDTGYVLQSVGPRVAVLAASLDAPAALSLEMPLPKTAVGGATPAPARFISPSVPATPAVQQPATVPSSPPPTAPGAPGMSGPSGG